MAQQEHTYEQLVAAFNHGNFQPCYFVYGDETYLAHELQELLIEKALAEHERDFNLDILYGSDTSAAAALSASNAYPMMAERRVVLIRDFEKLSQNALFAEYAKHPNPNAVVMLVCNSKPNLTNNPYRALKAQTVSIELKPLKAQQLGGWIQKRVTKFRKKIRPEAVQMLIDFTGNHLQSLAGEIEKMVAYVGTREEIGRDDVLDVGGHSREFNVFELQKSVGDADFLAASRIVEQMLQQKTNHTGEALMVVSVLTGFFTKLWKLTACQQQQMTDKAMAERVGISPYFIKEYLFSLRRYPLGRISVAFQALLAADYELKGGATREPSLILHLLLRRIIPQPR